MAFSSLLTIIFSLVLKKFHFKWKCILVFTPNSNKYDSYGSCNSTEMSFDADNHHIFINLRYYNIDELNAL